ncbi:MAG TPA: hybrid sensor histidine kinase/response regulator [Burkholderiales bacterium]
MRRLLTLLSLAGILPMAIVAAVILAAMARAQPADERALGALAALLAIVLLASGLFVWLAARRLGETIDALPADEAKGLRQALDEERRARQAAEAAARDKDEFLARLGHELRNPLGAIGNAVSVIERLPAGSADFRAARDVIGRQTEHLARIVDELREAGRAAGGRIALRRNLFDLSQAVADAVAALRHSSSHDWQLELRPVLVSADPARMDQVLASVLAHAAQASPPRSSVRVSLREEAAEALLQVEDSASAPHVAPESVGLALVHRLVELHGGRVSIEPRKDGPGARYTLRLPAIPEPEPVEGRHRRPPPAPRPARPARVLLVEDNDDARVMLQKILQAHGHLVSAARDARAGLEAAAAGSPNVAVVDIGLPGMDGYQFARAMRQRLGQGVRLIAVTGYGTDGHRQRAAEAGFDAHLTKPVDIDRLLGLIAET